MCLAEALLRIPDRETADKLIRDKISRGDWKAHLGNSASLFVNAAAWGLLVTGKLVASHSANGLSAAMTRLIAKGGEPLIRKGVDMAMRMLGKQFVTGETIEEALANGRGAEARGYRFSYDMLGEAAMTEPTRSAILQDYVTAIHAIGKASAGRGIYKPRHLGEAVGHPPALQPYEARADDGTAATPEGTVPVGQAVRYRPKHRCRGKRTAWKSPWIWSRRWPRIRIWMASKA